MELGLYVYVHLASLPRKCNTQRKLELLIFFFLSVKSPWTDNVFSSRNAIFEIFYIGIYLFLHAVMLFIF